MTALDNYGDLVENIFGPGSISFSKTGTYANSVIGALNDPANFKTFTNNFLARLRRLNAVYPASHPSRKTLLEQVSWIADDKWDGAYSELAAFDFLNQQCDAKVDPISLNVNIDVNRTYMLEHGGKGPANLDGHCTDWDVFFDVKALKDNAREILAGLCNEVYKRLGEGQFIIRPEYPLHMPYDGLETNRRALIDELVHGIDIIGKNRFLRSAIVDELTYRIEWTSGVSITESSYNPYEHAEQHFGLAFRHAKKYVKGEPFFLVFVTFPWFNGIITSVPGFDTIFFRSFARRVFCQYNKMSAPFSSMNKKFKGAESVYDVSRKLSGILFLKDHCIKGDHQQSNNLAGYFYFNPNADNKLTSKLFSDCIIQQHLCERDDFEHDNY